MRVSDLSTGISKLNTSMQTLSDAWHEVQEQWRDATAKQFEQRYLAELEPVVKTTLEAMNRMANLLAVVERDCEP